MYKKLKTNKRWALTLFLASTFPFTLAYASCMSGLDVSPQKDMDAALTQYKLLGMQVSVIC